RLAAEALGRVADSSAVPLILSVSSAPGVVADRILEHSLIFALIEIADRERTADGLKAPSAATRRVALIALDQMPGGGLDPQMVAGWLGSPEPVVRETAVWIVGRHPEWGDALAGYLRSRLDALGVASLTAQQGVELRDQLVLFSRSTPVQKLLAQMLDDPNSPAAARHLAFQVIAQSSLKEAPPEWVAALTKVLSDSDLAQIEQAVVAARALPPA